MYICSESKESACNTGDPGSILRSGRSTGQGSGTHSSILAWRIPCIEKPGGLQSMGLQRVRCDWMTNIFTFTYLYIYNIYIYIYFQNSLNRMMELGI